MDNRIKYLGYILALIIIMMISIYFRSRDPVRPVYLSDLTPKVYYQQHGKLTMDRSISGNILAVNGFRYLKGIGTHAISSIEYQLNGRYRFLEGAVGIDDVAVNNGYKIEALIYADEKLIYRSGIMQGWSNPHYFRLNIAGKKVIKLVIDDGGDGTNSDHSDWLGIQALP